MASESAKKYGSKAKIIMHRDEPIQVLEQMPKNLQRFTKVFLVAMPLVLLAGGIHCLYDAYHIHRD